MLMTCFLCVLQAFLLHLQSLLLLIFFQVTLLILFLYKDGHVIGVNMGMIPVSRKKIQSRVWEVTEKRMSTTDEKKKKKKIKNEILKFGKS